MSQSIIALTRRIRERLWSSPISRGVASSYFNIGIGLACNFLIIPLYLRSLGRDEYGLWLTISGLVTYLGLLNLGIAQTTANLFGAAVAKDQESECSRILATGFWTYAKVAAAALVLVVIVVPITPWHWLIKGSPALQRQAQSVLIFSCVGFLIELPCSLFAACLRTVGKVATQQRVAAFQNVARLVVALSYLKTASTLPGLIVLLSLTNIACGALQYYYLRREIPLLSLSYNDYQPALRREMQGPSAFYLLLQVSAAIAFSTDAVVISARLGTGQVALYASAQRLAFMASSIVGAIGANFGPSFLSAYAKGDRRRLRHLFLGAMWISAALGTAIGLSLLVFGPWFIRHWVGPANYVGFFPFSMIIGLMFLQMVLYPADSLLVITSNHKAYAIAAAWEASLNLTLSILLAPVLGVGGVAMATLIARVFGAGPVMLWKSLRIIQK